MRILAFLALFCVFACATQTIENSDAQSTTLRPHLIPDIQKAYDYMQDDKFGQAIPILDRLINEEELTPFELATLLELRSNALLNIGDYDAAIADLQRALSLDAFQSNRQEILYNNIERLRNPPKQPRSPIFRVPPKFPSECLEGRHHSEEFREIYVEVEFDISVDGFVKNARVIDSNDECIEDAVVTAVSKWRYAPKIVKGQPVEETGQTTTIRISY